MTSISLQNVERSRLNRRNYLFVYTVITICSFFLCLFIFWNSTQTLGRPTSFLALCLHIFNRPIFKAYYSQLSCANVLLSRLNGRTNTSTNSFQALLLSFCSINHFAFSIYHSNSRHRGAIRTTSGVWKQLH